MIPSYENITKAQSLFQKMIGACGPKCYRKLFTSAIREHTLEEFYPVVVHAELSAALALSVRAKEQDNNLDVYAYLREAFGIRPKNLVRLQTYAVADIMEKATVEVEDMLRELNFTVRNGIVTHHPDACRCVPEIKNTDSRVKIVKSCNS